MNISEGIYFKFTVSGKTGVEKIAIIDEYGRRPSTLLTVTDRNFTTTSSKITIKFYNGFGPTTEVYFDTDGKANITLPILFGDWKCGSKDENINCDLVRQGFLLWGGSYEIEFHGTIIYLNINYKFFPNQYLRRIAMHQMQYFFYRTEDQRLLLSIRNKMQ